MASSVVICPHCGEKLKLRSPSSDHSQIKCGNCKGKFQPASAADTKQINVNEDTAESKPLVARPRSTRRELPEPKAGSSVFPVTHEAMPGWMKVAGVGSLVVLSAVGLFFTRSAPPLPGASNQSTTPRIEVPKTAVTPVASTSKK